MTTATMVHRDQEVQQDVLAELRWDLGVAASEIGVAVKDGVVTLTGHVDTFLKKWRAEEATLRVNGVAAVANDIEVRLVGAERTDADIAAAAVNALNWNSTIPVNKVQVTVEKGWVTLKGEVEWQYQRREAEKAVRGLWGVKGVTNLITVKPAASPTDLKKTSKMHWSAALNLMPMPLRFRCRVARPSSRAKCVRGQKREKPNEQLGWLQALLRSTTRSASASSDGAWRARGTTI